MPYYEFQKIDEENTYTTIFFMSRDVPKIGEVFVDSDNITWKRVYSIPGINKDTKADPNSAKDFIKATNKKATFGEMFDLSREMSEARAAKNGGVDPIKENYLNNQEIKTGIEPFERKQKKIRDKLSKMGVTIKQKTK